MKKKTSKITHGGKHVPKLDKAQLEALVSELAKPERLAAEAQKLLRRLRDDPALMAIRFAPEKLAEAAQAAASEIASSTSTSTSPSAKAGYREDESRAIASKIADALVTEEAREYARRVLDARARAGGKLEEVLPFRVGVHLLEPENEARRPASENPFWLGVLSASAHDLPLALYLASRPAAEIEAEAARGEAAPAFARFLEGDARVRAVGRAMGQWDLEPILLHGMLGFLEAHEIALPLDAALRGPIEGARSERRRRTLAGVGSAAPARDEQAKVLVAAAEKDRDRAVPAYRAALLERFREARAQAADQATAVAGKRRLAALLATLVALETLPLSRNVPLLGAYESAIARAAEEAGDLERPLLHAVLGRPLDPAGYRAYAAMLLANAPPRGRAFAEAAAAAFPEDAELKALAAKPSG